MTHKFFIKYSYCCNPYSGRTHAGHCFYLTEEGEHNINIDDVIAEVKEVELHAIIVYIDSVIRM